MPAKKRTVKRTVKQAEPRIRQECGSCGTSCLESACPNCGEQIK